MDISLFTLAQRYVGIREFSEKGKDHPLVQWWLSLCGFDIESPDEIPWCSAFINGIAWELRLPRSKSAAARSWGTVGAAVQPDDLIPGAFDIAVLNRSNGSMDVTEPGPGHVGIFAGWDMDKMLLLGGNQGDQVCVRGFSKHDVIALRRLLS